MSGYIGADFEGDEDEHEERIQAAGTLVNHYEVGTLRAIEQRR